MRKQRKKVETIQLIIKKRELNKIIKEKYPCVVGFTLSTISADMWDKEMTFTYLKRHKVTK